MTNICRVLRSKAWFAPLQRYTRHFSCESSQASASDPHLLVEGDVKHVFLDIHKEIQGHTNHPELVEIASHYFDGQGKVMRPMLVMLMARAVNHHLKLDDPKILYDQRRIAMLSEMIHTTSLIHDDVIDQAHSRRGKPSVNMLWNHKKVTSAGDYMLALIAMVSARLKNKDATKLIQQSIVNLVQGELIQMGVKQTEDDRFKLYISKSYYKTASLITNTMKASSLLSGADEPLVDLVFQYGRNLGLAFQMVDDLLDFESSSELLGKPAAADLKLGLATAPVLFACEKYPELNAMIKRRFSQTGDVERAFEMVHTSKGLEQTRLMACEYIDKAKDLTSHLTESPYQKALISVSDMVLNRIK